MEQTINCGNLYVTCQSFRRNSELNYKLNKNELQTMHE